MTNRIPYRDASVPENVNQLEQPWNLPLKIMNHPICKIKADAFAVLSLFVLGVGGMSAIAEPSGVPAESNALMLDPLACQSIRNEGFPFSFVYGGRHSSEFLSGWNRTVDLKNQGDTQLVHTVTLTDPVTGLEVKAVAWIYTDTGGVDWTLFFTNHGKSDTPVIEQVNAVDVTFNTAPASPAVLHRLKGSRSAAEDWMPFDQVLPANETVAFATTNGRSSEECPFFNLDWGTGGVIAAIGWSGQWGASVNRGEGTIRLQAGMQGTHLKLHPGESIRSPRILLQCWSKGGKMDEYNAFRQTMMNHIMPRMDGELVVPPVAYTLESYREGVNSSEAIALAYIEAAKDLGFEAMWEDAWWMKGNPSFPNGVGNYGFPLERVPDPVRFPRGLKPVSDRVHADGSRFVLWFEPERVVLTNEIAKEHPEWVISQPVYSPNGEWAGSGLFDLGNPDARKFMTDYLNAAIKEYGVDILRFDFNIEPLLFWQSKDSDGESRPGISEIRWVEVLYKMWDDLRRANPQLVIDNCASGGRRIDLETCSRSIVLWRTDGTISPILGKNFNQAAMQDQLMSVGLNRYFPNAICSVFGTSPYQVRSGFNGGFASSEDVRVADFPRETFKQAITEIKRLRKYYTGNFYSLAAEDLNPAAWCVMQYDRPKSGDGMVMAFRRHQSQEATFPCQLQGIDSKANYEVNFFSGYDLSETKILPGDALQGLVMKIDECPGSQVIEYKKAGK